MNALTLYLLNAAWQIPVLAAVGWLCARAMRRAGPAAAHRIWAGALLAAPVLPACRLRPGALQNLLAGLGAWSHPAGTVRVSVTAAGLTGGAGWHPAAWAEALLLAAWVATTAAFAARVLHGLLRTRDLLRTAVCLQTASPAAHCLRRLCSRMGLIPPPLLALSAEAPTPATAGSRRATILLPREQFPRLAPGDLEAVLAHELVHVARRDYAKNIGYRLWMLPICWHPCSWWVLARVVESREMACDQRAAAILTGHRAYARSLLRLAALYAEDRGPAKASFAPGILDPLDRVLERRIAMLKQPPNPLGSLSRWLLVAACSLLATTVCVSAVALRADAGQPAAGATSTQPLTVPARELQDMKLGGDTPVYPLEAKRRRIQGAVVLDAEIDADGHIRSLQVVKSPNSLLSESAKTAVKTWIYRPYLLNGQPVPIRTTIHVVYRLGP